MNKKLSKALLTSASTLALLAAYPQVADQVENVGFDFSVTTVQAADATVASFVNESIAIPNVSAIKGMEAEELTATVRQIKSARATYESLSSSDKNHPSAIKWVGFLETKENSLVKEAILLAIDLPRVDRVNDATGTVLEAAEKDIDAVRELFNVLPEEAQAHPSVIKWAGFLTEKEDAVQVRKFVEFSMELPSTAEISELDAEELAKAKTDIATAKEMFEALRPSAKQHPSASKWAGFLDEKADAVEEAEELSVKSVSAINGLELQVTFSKPVKDSDATADKVTLVGNTSASTPTLWDGKFTKAELSKDGKVLTLTADKAIDVKDATLTVNPVKSKDDATVTSEKFVSLFTYKDTVAPSVVKNEGKDKSAEITFNEKLAVLPGVSVDGVNITPKFKPGSDNKVLVISGLENGKTYKVEIVGAKDSVRVPNVANPINLTVAPVADPAAVKQNVTISASGNKVTLNFVKEVSNERVTFAPAVSTTGTYTLDGNNATEDAIQYSTDKKTVTIDAQLLGVMGELNFQETKVTVDVDVNDATSKDVEKTVTLTADKVAPKLVSSAAKNITGSKTLQLNFDKAVDVPTSGNINLEITHIDGIRQASTIKVNGMTVARANDGATTPKDIPTALVVDLETGTSAASNFVAEKSYTVKVAKDAVTDVYTNGIVESTTTFTVPKLGTAVADPKAIITVPTVDVATHNKIKLTFDKALTNISAANFTLAGKVLPTGTVVEFVTNKKNVEITLPAGSIVTSGDYVLTIADVADAAGNTLKAGEEKQTVALTENVAPTVKSVTTPASDKVVVTFSEAVKLADADAPAPGATLKVNGTVVTATPVVAGTTLTYTLTGDNVLKVGDAVSVEFKDSDIVDTNNNKLADVVVNK